MKKQKGPKLVNTPSRLESLLKDSIKMVKTGKRPTETVPIELPRGVVLDKAGEIVVVVKTDAEKADLLYETRELRLSAQRRLDKLEKLESTLKQYFVDTLPVSKATGISGQVAQVKIEPKNIPQIRNWTKFYAYVKKTGSFDLLQRRLNETAVNERLDAKKKIPGLTIFRAKKVSVTKI